jgi:hypothetical protein
MPAERSRPGWESWASCNPKCRGSNPAAPASQSVSNASHMKVAQKPRGTARFRRYELVCVCVIWQWRGRPGPAARAFRRARMARLPPSRHAVHRGLWIPDLRARDDSPLKSSSHHAIPAICPTPRLSAQRMRRCGLNATSQTRLQRCDGHW